MNKKPLPYGLEPHEIGFLILLGVAFYFTGAAYWGKPWPLGIFSAALLAAVPVLILRCREEWRQLPNQVFFFTLAAVWVALFVFLGNPTFNYLDSPSLLAWMFNIYTSTSVDEGHGLLIPFVVLALFWWKRKELLARPPGLWWPAIGLVGLALLLHLVGFVSQQQRLSVVALLLGLYGLTGLAWGRHWLTASFFPFFLLVFCIPVAEFAAPLTLPLRLLVSRIVEIVAHLGLAPDLIREGTQLFDAQHTFGYEVAAACSGIRSLVALLALTTIYGFVNFRTPWKRVAMMLVAAPLAVLGNVVRLCFTVAVAETFGQNAGKAVETDFGFVTFAVAVGCAFLFARWLEKIAVEPPVTAQPAVEPRLATKPASPKSGQVIFLFLAVLLLTGATAGVLAHARVNQKLGAPGVKTGPLAGSKNLEVLLPADVPGFKSEALPQSEVVVKMLPQDTSYGQRLYTTEDGFQTLANVVLMGSSRGSIHKPQICLTAQGWTIVDAGSRVDRVHLDKPVSYDLPVMHLIASRPAEVKGQKLTEQGVYVYWFVDADRYTPFHAQRSWWMAQDVLLKNELDRWAYISFFAACVPGQEDAVFERMKKLIAASVPEFQLVPKAAK
jgi:exosortase